jgi:hypothetical protein
MFTKLISTIIHEDKPFEITAGYSMATRKELIWRKYSTFFSLKYFFRYLGQLHAVELPAIDL